jgi:hypothetical protein
MEWRTWLSVGALLARVVSIWHWRSAEMHRLLRVAMRRKGGLLPRPARVRDRSCCGVSPV